VIDARTSPLHGLICGKERPVKGCADRTYRNACAGNPACRGVLRQTCRVLRWMRPIDPHHRKGCELVLHLSCDCRRIPAQSMAMQAPSDVGRNACRAMVFIVYLSPYTQMAAEQDAVEREVERRLDAAAAGQQFVVHRKYRLAATGQCAGARVRLEELVSPSAEGKPVAAAPSVSRLRLAVQLGRAAALEATGAHCQPQVHHQHNYYHYRRVDVCGSRCLVRAGGGLLDTLAQIQIVTLPSPQYVRYHVQTLLRLLLRIKLFPPRSLPSPFALS
jgi:hypothetical protein